MKTILFIELATLLLFCVSPPALRAQETPAALIERQKIELKEEVARLLKSGTPRDRAWAAHLCVKHGLKEFTPQLESAIDEQEGPVGNPRSPRFFANQAVLDALIQLEADVPAEHIRSLYPRHPDEVVFLLAQDARKNADALLAILKGRQWSSRSLQFAILSQLVLVRAPGVVAYLMKQPATLYVTASETGTEAGIPGGAAGTDQSTGPFEVPPDFPPIGFHRFNGEQIGTVSPTNPVYCSAPVTIHRQRFVVSATGPYGTTTDDSWGGDEAYFARMVAFLDDQPDRLSDFPNYARPLKWEGPEKVHGQLFAIRRDVNRAFNSLKERLLRKGLLTRDEADGIHLDLKMTFLLDGREDRTLLLPRIPVSFGRAGHS